MSRPWVVERLDLLEQSRRGCVKSVDEEGRDRCIQCEQQSGEGTCDARNLEITKVQVQLCTKTRQNIGFPSLSMSRRPVSMNS